MEGSQQDENQTKGKLKGGRSCKGCLYYSSDLKSKSRKPRCVGISRTLPQVPKNYVGESEMEASKEGRTLIDFKYACVGYSVHLDNEDPSANPQEEKRPELPFCLGIEVLVDRRPSTADNAQAPSTAPIPVLAPSHSREDGPVPPKPRPHKPAHPIGEEFLSRFSRNASVVASGVTKNVYRVGNYIKSNIDDVLYPYRRRPK